MTQFVDLTHQFLIAMPGLADPNFSGAVIFVCEHNSRGALGLVINRPLDLTLSTLFDRIDLNLEIDPWKSQAVYYGGPVQTDRGFVLHMPTGDYGSTLPVTDQLGLTTSKDVLEAVAQGEGPARLFVTLGYTGWAAGQIEEELKRNAWLTVPAQIDLIFDIPPTERFDAALRLLGIDSLMLCAQAGHA